jgi:molybdate transport system substrate-binding protein
MNRVAVSALLLCGVTAHAEEIRVLSSVGIQAVVDELTPEFERTTGHNVSTVFGLASALKERIDDGEAFDVAILTPPLLDDLIEKGTVAPGTRAVIASVGLGFMIRAGTPKPDVGSVDAFERALRDAPSITYATAGASGVAFLATIERLGIADSVRAKAIPAASGEEVATNVTGGIAELGVLPVSEILPVQGAELGGVFPADMQTYIVMVAGLSAESVENSAARQFVAFLVSPLNTPVINAKGMQR